GAFFVRRTMNEVTDIAGARGSRIETAEVRDDSRESRIRSSSFRPARWLRNRHAQTIYPSIPIPGIPKPRLVREPLELPDGDVTVVDWLTAVPDTDDSSPILIVLHGLESSARSTYARQLLHAAAKRGWRAAVLHFRDCGDYCNRLPRRYHAGETGDIRYFLHKLRSLGHRGPLLAAGFSLGGNVLLKYLGESREETPLTAAVAVSVPLNLHAASLALSKGFSKFYQHYLLTRMKRSVRRKFDPFTAAFDWERAMKARTFAEFDDAVTAPLHGFADKNDYYDRCSAMRYLDGIARPSLIINALDDPFMTPDVIPAEDSLSEFVTVEVSEQGGHVGFIHGGTPWRPQYYIPQRIIEFLEPQL
ncbi:MAG TPA: hydrolase, partial [Woeseiaceae bacterium]|nr:hydrolase [Woeseiaceae bacterium]